MHNLSWWEWYVIMDIITIHGFETKNYNHGSCWMTLPWKKWENGNKWCSNVPWEDFNLIYCSMRILLLPFLPPLLPTLPALQPLPLLQMLLPFLPLHSIHAFTILIDSSASSYFGSSILGNAFNAVPFLNPSPKTTPHHSTIKIEPVRPDYSTTYTSSYGSLPTLQPTIPPKTSRTVKIPIVDLSEKPSSNNRLSLGEGDISQLNEILRRQKEEGKFPKWTILRFSFGEEYHALFGAAVRHITESEVSDNITSFLDLLGFK